MALIATQKTLCPFEPLEGSWRFRCHFKLNGPLLSAEFLLQGPLDQVFWPERAQPRWQDKLYLTTCFELFILQPSGYQEWNFSPSGCWAAFQFQSYRQQSTNQPSWAEPACRWDISPTEAKLAVQWETSPVLDWQPSAVIAFTSKSLTYWSPQHLSDKPDFHAPFDPQNEGAF